MFKDASSWAVFQYENAQRWNALFDHFWVDTRSTLWTAAAVDPAYPKTLRAQGVDGGYVFQLLYSAEDRKENELKAKWWGTLPPATLVLTPFGLLEAVSTSSFQACGDLKWKSRDYKGLVFPLSSARLFQLPNSKNGCRCRIFPSYKLDKRRFLKESFPFRFPFVLLCGFSEISRGSQRML